MRAEHPSPKAVLLVAQRLVDVMEELDMAVSAIRHAVLTALVAGASHAASSDSTTSPVFRIASFGFQHIGIDGKQGVETASESSWSSESVLAAVWTSAYYGSQVWLARIGCSADLVAA